MSTSSVAPETTTHETTAAKVPLLALMLAMVMSVLLSVGLMGGAIFYLIRSGRLPVQKGIVVETKIERLPATPALSHVMTLEPMVANLADTNGTAYLKMSLALRVADDPKEKPSAEKDAKPAKGISDAESAVRDTVLSVVGRQTAEMLLAPDGKDRLKSALKSALAERNPDMKVLEIYFVDFLVQR